MNTDCGRSTRCWVGKTLTSYPRFEAWDSNGAGDSRWRLRVVLNPGAKPIEVRELRSLDEARQFAAGMLTGLGGSGGGKLPVESHVRPVEEVHWLVNR